jgi:hypothetical protein
VEEDPIAKSRVLAAPVLRILSRKGFTGVVSFENFLIIFFYCLSDTLLVIWAVGNFSFYKIECHDVSFQSSKETLPWCTLAIFIN